MKFKSIRLKNFMRYKGDVSIEFSTDPVKNVTIILGDNSFGKTTIAQAFRWGLYGEVATTNYTHKKDVVLLNNEVIASMAFGENRAVEVEICVLSDEGEYTFVRKQHFTRKSANPAIYSIKPLSDVSVLRMQITKPNGSKTPWIDDASGNGNEYPAGCVKDTISNMFPKKLSSYFFFDGERWNNEVESHGKDELKKSIYSILGISSYQRMLEHLKDGVPGNRTTVEKILQGNIQGSSEQSEQIKKLIEGIDIQLSQTESKIEEKTSIKDTLQEEVERYTGILNDGKKAEEDQILLKKYEKSITTHKNYRDGFYADLVKQASRLDQMMAASLLPAIERELASVDLEGKDIPGVTSDTIDYLIKAGICLCGTELKENDPHYTAMLNLRAEVYPNKIGGPAKAYKEKLREWGYQTESLLDEINKKAEGYETEQFEIESTDRKRAELEERIDKKMNMEAVRRSFNQSRERLKDVTQDIAKLEVEKDNIKKKAASYREQLEMIEKQNDANKHVYKAIEYNNKVYELAKQYLDRLEKPTVDELNKMIGENFRKMFGSQDKYARLDSSYQVKLYYRSVNGITDFEEENISVGERISLNFAYIVSILELAKKRKEDVSGEAVSSLPLVLDAPFSNLSGDNTGTVAAKLPMFAEQVIVFMLDKDLEASGLTSYSDSRYRYRVHRNIMDNNSEIVLNENYMGGIE